MPRYEQVIIAFRRIRVAHKTTATTYAGKLIESAGDEFVRIDLVAGIPDQAVLREIECQVQRNAELNDTQVAGEMSRAIRDDREQCFANLV